MSLAHDCSGCPGRVSSEFGCRHFGSPWAGGHYRHAICCTYITANGGQKPPLPLLTGRAAARALRAA